MFEIEFTDMERAPIDKVLETLRCDTNGLSTKQAEERLALFGPNKFKKRQESDIVKFIRFMWNPLAWIMVASAIMALVLANGVGMPMDWKDFVGIIVLLLFNSLNSFIVENNARIASDALMVHLAAKTKILRDGKWVNDDASMLVPGDIIRIMAGDKIPADCRLLEGDPWKVDQSALTVGSYLVKDSGDVVYCGSICMQGESEAVVISTGHTLLGSVNLLVDTMNQEDGHVTKALADVRCFYICFMFMGLFVEIMGIGIVQERGYRVMIDNLLVLLIGGIPIAMPSVFSYLMATGSHKLSKQGVIIKRMYAIEEIGSMDVLFTDRTGVLTMNKLSVARNLIEVFADSVESDVVLMAARASRVENEDAVDAAIVGLLKDPKEARAGIQEVNFLPFNQKDKRTTLTYINNNDGKMYRVSKGAPEQILNLVHNKCEIEQRVLYVIDKYAEQGLQSLAVAYQEVSEGSKESPWQLVGLIPLLDPVRHDSAETIRQAQDLGVNVKMITGDELAIAKETGRSLGLGTNMYPATPLLGKSKYYDLIQGADGYSSVFPEQKNEIVKHLQEKQIVKHICGITGDGADDVPALKKAKISIAVADATDAARSASDILLTKPGLSDIISVILTSRTISQKTKNCVVYALSNTVRIVLGFCLISIIWEFNFPPFMALLIAIFHYSTMLTMINDRVKPSPKPDSWKMSEIFTTGIILGGYLATMTVIFFWAAYETEFFPRTFKVTSLYKKDVKDFKMLASAVFLQVSTTSQALIFVTRSRGEGFGVLLMLESATYQIVTTTIAVHANIGFDSVEGIGWHWAGVILLYNLICCIPLYPLKLFIRYILSERKENFEREEHHRRWAHAVSTLQSRYKPETESTGHNNDGIQQQREDEDDMEVESFLLL